MVSRLLESDADGQNHPYMRYSPLTNDGEDLAEAATKRESPEMGDGESADTDLKALVDHATSRSRSSSSGLSLKNRLKQVKAGFSNERRSVVDAFIDSTKNKPQYVKDEHSSDLLV